MPILLAHVVNMMCVCEQFAILLVNYFVKVSYHCMKNTKNIFRSDEQQEEAAISGKSSLYFEYIRTRF